MELLSSTTEKLERWIKPETWHTFHPDDMERFYGFVKALSEEDMSFFDEAVLGDQIRRVVRENHPGFNEESRDEVIREHIRKISTIFDYLKYSKGL